MDAVLESNSAETFNRKDEIKKTTQQILELAQAMESLTQSKDILEAERNRLCNEINKNKHRMLTEFISDLMNEIYRLEVFSSIPLGGHPISGRSLPFPTDKELGEPFQRSKVQLQHNSKNLAMERRMSRELREHERERQKQLKIKADFALLEANQQAREQACNIKLASINHRSKSLPKKSIKSLIVMWAEKIEYTSSQAIRDSKNVAPTRKAYEHLYDLQKTSKKFYSHSSIDKKKFAKHWNLMRETINSFEQIKFDLKKESRRHAEGYAETQRLRDKMLELSTSAYNMSNERIKLWYLKSAARKYLSELRNEVATINYLLELRNEVASS